MQKPRLLVLTSTFPRWPGDKEPPFVYELSKRLTTDYEVHVLAPHAPGAALEEQYDNLQITRFRYCFERYQTLTYGGGILANLKQQRWRYLLIPLFLVAEFLALLRLARNQSFAVIHAHWIIPQGLVAILAKPVLKNSPPIICTSHGGDLFALSHPLGKALKRLVLTHSQAITVVSHAMREKVLELGIAAAKVQVISMGVDLQTTFVPPPLGSQRQPYSLLFVGRLVEKKGLSYLLAALPLLSSRYPTLQLTVVGSGAEENLLKQQVIALNLPAQVSFLGAMTNQQLPRWYQTTSIVIFPSIVAADGDTEGFGLVLVEALGCECAVIATDLPAMQDILTPGETALIVPPKNAQRLAEAIDWLWKNDLERERLGQQGRQSVLGHYDWSVIAEKYLALLNHNFHNS